MTKQAKKIRELGLQELKAKLEELKINYAKEIVKSKTGAKNEKAVNLRNLRKEIARVLTIISEKEYSAITSEKKSEKKSVVKSTNKDKKSEKSDVKKVVEKPKIKNLKK